MGIARVQHQQNLSVLYVDSSKSSNAGSGGAQDASQDRHGCSRCVTCSAFGAHTQLEGPAWRQLEEWWPCGIQCPVLYFRLSEQELARSIWWASLRPAGLWRPADSSVTSGSSAVLERRALRPISVHLPATYTNFAQDDTPLQYMATILLPLPKMVDSLLVSAPTAPRSGPCPVWDDDADTYSNSSIGATSKGTGRLTVWADPQHGAVGMAQHNLLCPAAPAWQQQRDGSTSSSCMTSPAGSEGPFTCVDMIEPHISGQERSPAGGAKAAVQAGKAEGASWIASLRGLIDSRRKLMSPNSVV